MGNSESAGLGRMMKKLGVVGRVVHEYIGSATIVLAYVGYKSDASIVCGAEGDIYAFREFGLNKYPTLRYAIRYGKNQFALDFMAAECKLPIGSYSLEGISDAIVESRNMEFLRELICRRDVSVCNVRSLCHDLAGSIADHKRRDDQIFAAQCITMPLPRQHLGRDVTNHFITAPRVSQILPVIRELLPDSEDAARFEREVRAV